MSFIRYKMLKLPLFRTLPGTGDSDFGEIDQVLVEQEDIDH